jgi:hypothetical protein
LRWFLFRDVPNVKWNEKALTDLAVGCYGGKDRPSTCDLNKMLPPSTPPSSPEQSCGMYRGANKSLARPISRCILFDGENISFDASLVIYVNSTNIPPIMIINRIYETQHLLSL